jgi:hypothetical protein
MSKTFNIAGTSSRNGVVKARFANDMSRVKTLVKTGHTEINLVELPNAMTKEDAVAFLVASDFAAGNEVAAAALAAFQGKRSSAPRKSRVADESVDAVAAR